VTTKTGIDNAIKILQRVFVRYEPDGDTVDLIYELTGDIGDTELLDGARQLCATETRQPGNMIAALRAAAANIRERRLADTAQASQRAEQGGSLTYWERTSTDRAEIDEARAECMAVIRRFGVDTRTLEREATAKPDPETPLGEQIDGGADNVEFDW
jgi:hypothetical protein